MRKIENRIVNKLYKEYLCSVSESNKESYMKLKEQKKEKIDKNRPKKNISF